MVGRSKKKNETLLWRRFSNSKCKVVAMEDIRANGLEILGTCAGPLEAGRTFLKKKVEAQVATL
jgi:hypothetical protein